MQASAAAPQASDRIWCKPATPALTAIRFQFVVGAHTATQVHVVGGKSSEFPNVENLAESVLRASSSDSKTRAGKAASAKTLAA
jgi:hypothetical protein